MASRKIEAMQNELSSLAHRVHTELTCGNADSKAELIERVWQARGLLTDWLEREDPNAPAFKGQQDAG